MYLFFAKPMDIILPKSITLFHLKKKATLIF